MSRNRKKRKKRPSEASPKAPEEIVKKDQKESGETPQEETPGIKPLAFMTRKRTGFLFVGTILVGGLWLAHSDGNETNEALRPTPAPPTSPELPPPPNFERRFEISGVEIALDESWKNFHPENNVSVSETFKKTLERALAFFQEAGLPLPQERITFSYDPTLADRKRLGETVQGHSKYGRIKWPPDFNRGEASNYVCRNRPTSPRSIRLRMLDPETIVHELFHFIHGAELQGSDIWKEGIALALARLFKKQHPNLAVIADRRTATEDHDQLKLDASILAMVRDESILPQLTENGLETNIPSFMRTSQRQLTWTWIAASVVWESFLENNPQFIGSFIRKLQENSRQKLQDINLPESKVVVVNSHRLEELAHETDLIQFRRWHRSQNMFQLMTPNTEIAVAYQDEGGKVWTFSCRTSSGTIVTEYGQKTDIIFHTLPLTLQGKETNPTHTEPANFFSGPSLPDYVSQSITIRGTQRTVPIVRRHKSDNDE